MKKRTTRISAMILASAMILSLAACGGSGDKASETTAAKQEAAASVATEEKAAETTAPAAPESKLTGPVTVTLWHSRGTGVHLDEMQRAVAEFNETNDKQITVNEEYIGTNKEISAKVATAIAGGNNCQIVVGGASEFAPEGVVADMMPFAQRDGFDLDNILPVFQRGMYYEGQLIQLPYIRSAAVIYYNKDIFSEAGYDTVPGDIVEFKAALEKIRDTKGIMGLGMATAPDFVQGALIKSINGLGNVSEDGLTPISLDDGSLKTVTQWWLDGVNDGTIMNYTVKEAENNFKNAFYDGQIACYAASCQQMGQIMKNCEKSGVNLGIAPLPGFNGEAVSSPGGSNIYILSANSTDEQIEASWEFIKFLLSDEQVFYNASNTGYLPVTKSVENNPDMQEFWAKEENKLYKDAYDVLKLAIETPDSPYVSAWHKEITKMWDSVILEQSMNVDEGMEWLESERTVFWP